PGAESPPIQLAKQDKGDQHLARGLHRAHRKKGDDRQRNDEQRGRDEAEKKREDHYRNQQGRPFRIAGRRLPVAERIEREAALGTARHGQPAQVVAAAAASAVQIEPFASRSEGLWVETIHTRLVTKEEAAPVGSFMLSP